MIKNQINIKLFAFSITVLIAITGCSKVLLKTNINNTATSGITTKEDAILLEHQSKNIGVLANKIDLPPVPEKNKAKRTVQGIDLNKNNTRDDLEQIAYQGLNLIDGVNIETYKQIISIMNMIQPKEPFIKNSINEHDIYCLYKKLPNKVKKELPLDFIYSVVLDTQKRRTTFKYSLTPSTVNLEAELCK
jgi:hypothetical protein